MLFLFFCRASSPNSLVSRSCASAGQNLKGGRIPRSSLAGYPVILEKALLAKRMRPDMLVTVMPSVKASLRVFCTRMRLSSMSSLRLFPMIMTVSVISREQSTATKKSRAPTKNLDVRKLDSGVAITSSVDSGNGGTGAETVCRRGVSARGCSAMGVPLTVK